MLGLSCTDFNSWLDLQSVRVEERDVVLRNVVAGRMEDFRGNDFGPGLELRVVLIVELDQIACSCVVDELEPRRNSLQLGLGDRRMGKVRGIIAVWASHQLVLRHASQGVPVCKPTRVWNLIERIYVGRW